MLRISPPGRLSNQFQIVDFRTRSTRELVSPLAGQHCVDELALPLALDPLVLDQLRFAAHPSFSRTRAEPRLRASVRAMTPIAGGPGLAKGQINPCAVPYYNSADSLIGPALLASATVALGLPALWTGGAFAWAAHIVADRTLGFGPRGKDGFQRGAAL